MALVEQRPSDGPQRELLGSQLADACDDALLARILFEQPVRSDPHPVRHAADALPPRPLHGQNRRYQALKQFGLWLVRTRRVQFDPFDGLRALNEEADRRHVRRALTPEDAERLLEAARTRPLSWTCKGKRVEPKTLRQRVRLQRLGETRALIYAVALGTGLRRSEIRRLRWCDVDVEARRVTVPAASAKSRRVQTVPLSSALVDLLAASRPTEAEATDLVVPPSTFPNTLTFHRDLEAARIPRRDAEGRVVDFHALRTTFVSWLAMTGAHPKVAQALARHASIETTMERYTDLAVVDVARTVENLPRLTASRTIIGVDSPNRTGKRAGEPPPSAVEPRLRSGPPHP